MIRLIAFAAFALAVATTAQAMSPVPLHQSDDMITQVRQHCGRDDCRPPQRPQVRGMGCRARLP